MHRNLPEADRSPQSLIQAVFTLSRLWERIFDRAFRADGISVKQFFLMAVIDRAFEFPPSLGDAAHVLKMSYQNVKKLALQLEKKGLLSLQIDKNDRRVLRLQQTAANIEYWKKRSRDDEEDFKALFQNVSASELASAISTISRLAENAETAAGKRL